MKVLVVVAAGVWRVVAVMQGHGVVLAHSAGPPPCLVPLGSISHTMRMCILRHEHGARDSIHGTGPQQSSGATVAGRKESLEALRAWL